jgi:hypothetical protein
MARGAFSEIYKGVTIDALPTPNPAIRRPTYIRAIWPSAAAWNMQPIVTITAAMRRATRLPRRSATYDATRAPAKHPHCKVDTILACRLALWVFERPSRPYFLDARSEHGEVHVGQDLCLRLEGRKSKDTADNPRVYTEQHTAEACLTTLGLARYSKGVCLTENARK